MRLTYDNIESYLSKAEAFYNGDFTYVEVTEGADGYPKNLRPAITGFKDFAEAEDFAKANNMLVHILSKRDGHDFWNDNGWSSEQAEITEDDFGEGYEFFYPGSLAAEEGFWIRRIEDDPVGISSFDDLRGYIEQKEEVCNNIKEAMDGQVVVTRNGEYIDTIETKPMSWHDNNCHCYCYGVF